MGWDDHPSSLRQSGMTAGGVVEIVVIAGIARDRDNQEVWHDCTDDTDSAEGRLFHLEHDRSLIVKDLCTGGKLVCCSENSVHNLSRGAACIFGDDVFNAAAAKRFIF